MCVSLCVVCVCVSLCVLCVSLCDLCEPIWCVLAYAMCVSLWDVCELMWCVSLIFIWCIFVRASLYNRREENQLDASVFSFIETSIFLLQNNKE